MRCGVRTLRVTVCVSRRVWRVFPEQFTKPTGARERERRSVTKNLDHEVYTTVRTGRVPELLRVNSNDARNLPDARPPRPR